MLALAHRQAHRWLIEFLAVDNLLNFAGPPKQICIKHLMPKGTIESFNVSILVGLARLDVNDLDLLSLAPLDKGRPCHFGAAVHLNTTRLAVLRNKSTIRVYGSMGDPLVRAHKSASRPPARVLINKIVKLVDNGRISPQLRFCRIFSAPGSSRQAHHSAGPCNWQIALVDQHGGRPASLRRS